MLVQVLVGALRTFDLLELELQVVVSYLPNRGVGLSSSPLQEQQQMILTTEPALQFPEPFKNFEKRRDGSTVKEPTFHRMRFHSELPPGVSQPWESNAFSGSHGCTDIHSGKIPYT